MSWEVFSNENEITVDKGFNGYLALPLDINSGLNRVFIEIEKNPDLSVFGTTERVIGAPSASAIFQGGKPAYFYGQTIPLPFSSTFLLKFSVNPRKNPVSQDSQYPLVFMPLA